MTDAVPSWVRALCRHDFFSACAGQHDRASSRPPVHNLFCVDCELQVCPECADSEHEGHRILKIRRASMQDAVLLEEIRECEDFDVSDIQPAIINSSDILYLGHHLSSMLAPVEENDFEGCKTRKSLSPEKFASPGARFPEGRWTFCSIACKIAGITKKEPRMLTAARVRSVERAKIADKLIPAPVAAAPPPALAVPPKAKWKARAKGEAPAPAPAPAPKPAAKKPPAKAKAKAKKPPAKAKAKAKKPPAKAKSPPAPPVAVTKRRSARTTKARDVVTTAAAAAAADALITLARETETETTSEETTTPAKHRTPEPRRVLRSKDNAANVERGTSSSDKVAAAAVAPPCFEGSFAFAPGSHLSSERDEDGRLLRGGGDSISLGLDLAAAARMGAAANTPPALSRMTREADTPGFGYVGHEPTRAPDSAGSSLLIHNYGIVASPGIISVPRPRPRKSGKGKSTAAAAAAAAAALRIVTPPMPYLDDGSGLPFGELTDVTPTEPPATLAKKEGKKRQKTMKVSPMGSPR